VGIDLAVTLAVLAAAGLAGGLNRSPEACP